MNVLDVDALQAILDAAFFDVEVPVVEEVAGHTVVVSQSITARHERPGGTVSGPLMMMLADTTAWVAILAQIGPVLLAVTTSLHIDFLRKPEMTDLVARGTVLKLGRKLAVVDVAIHSRGSDALVAKAQVTYALPSSNTTNAA
ncbi:MAG: PaaI family thioesterase [Acidimicrobiales bacterium]